MRLTAMMAMVMGTGFSGQAAEAPARVAVYFRDSASVPVEVRGRAQFMAAQMFAGIGVQIDWHTGVPGRSSGGRALAIELTTNTPDEFLPDVMAYALPYEGVHIRVLYDRIRPNQAPTELLAHVLAHEITHILEGTSHHSDTGVMKAYWSAADLAQMQHAPLPFTEQDIDLIRAGLEARNSGSPALIATNMTPAAVEVSAK